jgi:predicted N-acetyltransferase YhbS
MHPNEAPIHFRGNSFRLATEADVPQIRRLVNNAYAELADRGLNYTATYQDEAMTLDRMSQGRTYLLEQGGKLVGTIILKKENHFTGLNSAYLGQLAVSPDLKRTGLGTLLMDLGEHLATIDGFESVQLDTAQPATHLVAWYVKRGYKIVGEMQWEGKTYRSWIFEKLLVRELR